MNRILIAGLGNVFHGDDAFGVETVRQLEKLDWPQGVEIVDFGIRAYDLAFTIADGYDVVVMVDAMSRDERPGTVFVIGPIQNSLQGADLPVDSQSLSPATVLRIVNALGGRVPRVYLVACQPASLEYPDREVGLSTPVAGAVPRAVVQVKKLVGELYSGGIMTKSEPVRRASTGATEGEQ